MAEEIVKKRRARIKVTPVEVPAAEPIVEETTTIATPSIPNTEETKENVESTEKLETILSKTEKRVIPEKTYGADGKGDPRGRVRV